MVLITNNLIAQHEGVITIKTPTNVEIQAINFFEDPNVLAGLEADAAAFIDEHNLNAVRIGPASITFNCHGYAWHMIDGGDPCVIADTTYRGDQNLSKYWTDSPIYVETNSSNGTKVNYPDGSHSAVATDQEGIVISKWANWPLYRHAPSECPYSATNLKYYHIPVNGSDLICFSNSYSTYNLSGATYNWEADLLNFSGSGSSTLATKSGSGEEEIYAYITSPYSGTTVLAKKTVWIGKPGVPTTNPSGYPTEDIPLDAYFNVSLVKTPGASSSMPINWWSSGSIVVDHTTPNGCTFHAEETGIGNFYVTTRNSCGTSAAGGGTVNVYSGSGGGGGGLPRPLSVSPNPANDYIEAYIENLTEEEKLDNEKLHIKIVNSNSIPVYNGTTQQKKFQINTSSFPEGVYYLLVQYKNQKYSTTILISR